MFNKADFEKILVLYYKILYPKSFLYSLDDLKKIGLYTYCYVYTHDYSFFEFFMSKNNIPFTISPNANLYDHDTIHVWFDKKYSDEVINFLNSLASDTRLYKIEMNNVSTDEDYLFATVMQNTITLSSLVSSPAIHEWESKQKENAQNRINKQKNANLKSQW